MTAMDAQIQLMNVVSAPQSSSSVLRTIIESPSPPLIQSESIQMATSKPFQRSTSLNDTNYHRNIGYRNYEAFSSLGHINLNSNESAAPNVPEIPLRGRDSWLSSKQGATLVWRDVCVYATSTPTANSRNLRRIINNSMGAIQPGTLMAVMGSSGAGKSTLMSALACRNACGTIVQGEILCNGRRVGPFMHRMSGFVHQDDLFHASLTVFEHMYFMAHLRLDRRISKAHKVQLIRDLLDRTGLTKCANTKIGDAYNGNMLSGGEKKRLAFATELLNNPSILFCDEPTTGLDSYSAQQLVGTLLALARQGTTIMCTIHQPSSQLFAMFHQVLLLAEGRLAFMGPPRTALEFFANNGYNCPPSFNPADFIIGVLATAPGSEKASQRTATRLCDLFAVSEEGQRVEMLVNLEFSMAESGEFQRVQESQFQKPIWLLTVYWLVHRNFLGVLRDPTIQTLRVVQKLAIAFMCGLCFFGTIDLSQHGIQSVQGAIFVIIAENTFGPMYSVLGLFPQDLPLFVRERTSGNYNTVQYYIAHIVALIPGLIIEPFLFVVVGYWLSGMRTTVYAFAMTTFLAIMVMNVATACGCFFSTAFRSVPVAIAYLVPFDAVLMITSGVFIQLDSMSKYISWTKYLSWMMYANEAMTIVQWEGVSNITCPQNTQLPCLHTADEIFEKYSFSTDNMAMDVWAMVALYVVFNILGLLSLWKRTRKMC